MLELSLSNLSTVEDSVVIDSSTDLAVSPRTRFMVEIITHVYDSGKLMNRVRARWSVLS